MDGADVVVKRIECILWLWWLKRVESVVIVNDEGGLMLCLWWLRRLIEGETVVVMRNGWIP